MRRGMGDSEAPLLPRDSFYTNGSGREMSNAGQSFALRSGSSFARGSDQEMSPVPNRSLMSSPRSNFNTSFARRPSSLPVSTEPPPTYTRSQRRFLQELRQLMEEKMTTDIFALFAAVLRRRAGVIDISKTERNLWDALLRKKDLMIVGYSFFGLLVSITMTTMFWEFGGNRHTTLPEVTPDQLTLLYCAQLAITLSTLACMVLIAQKYYLLLMNKRMEWASTSMYDLLQAENNEAVQERYMASYSFMRSSLRWKLAFELVVHLMHPLIWMNTDETKAVYEAFQILIFARLYLAVNVIFKFSEPFQRRREIVSNNPELQRTGFQPSVGGTMKMLFYDHPYTTTLAALVATLLILGFIVFVSERSIEEDGNEFRRLQNCIWFAFVTFSTVGYGDMSPVTGFGRLASVAIGAVGITTTTVFGGVVTNLMVQSREQRSVMQYLSETAVDKKVEDSAACVIQHAYRYSRAKQKDIVNPWQGGGHKSNLVYGSIKRFKTVRWQQSQTQSSTNDPVTDNKINSVNATLGRTRRAVDSSRATVKQTRNAVRTFVSELQGILNRAQDDDRTSVRSPSGASRTQMSPTMSPRRVPTFATTQSVSPLPTPKGNAGPKEL